MVTEKLLPHEFTCVSNSENVILFLNHHFVFRPRHEIRSHMLSNNGQVVRESKACGRPFSRCIYNIAIGLCTKSINNNIDGICLSDIRSNGMLSDL